MSKEIPVIAIIGRPNTGKSTLFNRLVGKRRAITDPTAGVTRDLLQEKWFLGGHQAVLIDSGGVKLDKEGFDDLVSRKSLSILDSADAVIFLVDCMELTPEDHALMQKLRPYEAKTILTVNKIDDETRDDLVWNFFSFGFQRVVGISSAHGIGIDLLEETLLGMLGLEELVDIEQEAPRLKLALLGKPNTGKSTLANYLVKKEISIVSDIPGTTRDVVIGEFSYKGTEFEILDTAGIRRKTKVDDDVEYYSVNRAIKTIDEADVVLLMIDSIEGLSEQDKKIAALIVRRGKGVIMVLNKADLLSGVANQYAAMEDRVRFLFPVLSFAPLCFISALTGKGVEELMDTVLKIEAQLNHRVDTSVVNNALRAWTESYQPSRGAEGHNKVYYGTQISADPVKFLFFVNKVKDFPQNYISYLNNCVRKDLGFPSVPVEIDLRERRRNTSNNALGPKPTEKAEPRPKAAPKSTSGRAIAKPRPKKPGAKAKAIAMGKKR